MKRHVVIAGEGDPCPRCGQPTEIREHACISNSELRRPFYYRRWFMCRNPDCRTTTIVPAQYRVFNAPEPPWCRETVGVSGRSESAGPRLCPLKFVSFFN
jgi:hypothetical protein